VCSAAMLSTLSVTQVLASDERKTVFLGQRSGAPTLAFVKGFPRQPLTHPDQIRSAKSLLREVQALQRLALQSHPFIVDLSFSLHDEHRLYLGLENVAAGDVCDLLLSHGPLAENHARQYAIEVALALGHVHSHDIMHRDVKPENVVIGFDGHVKLTDFGECQKLTGRVGNTPPPPRPTSLCGTPDYIAPEVFRGAETCETCDWWSFGCLVYEMATGRSLFDQPDLNELIRRVLEFTALPPGDHLSEALQAFLLALLLQNPNQRLGARPFGHQAVVHDPWFAGLDTNAVLRRELPVPWLMPLMGGGTAFHALPAPTVDPVTIHAQGQAVAQAGGAWLDYSAPEQAVLVLPHLLSAFAHPTELVANTVLGGTAHVAHLPGVGGNGVAAVPVAA